VNNELHPYLWENFMEELCISLANDEVELCLKNDVDVLFMEKKK